MKQLLVRLLRQSPAMIVAMLALFVALTGTAVATTSALITGNQIKNSSITGADVKNRSLRPVDFRGSVRGPRGLRGLTGAPGAKGDKGDTGPPGAPNPNAANSDLLDGIDSTAFVRNSGFILVAAPWGAWVAGSGATVTFQHFRNVTEVNTVGAGSDFVHVHPSIPVALYGQSLRLRGIEFCYNTTGATVTLGAVFFDAWRNATGTHGEPGGVTFTDETDQTDQACRVYNLATPFVMNDEHVVNFAVRLESSAAGTFHIGRTTFILEPAGTTVPTPASAETATLRKAESAAGLAP